MHYTTYALYHETKYGVSTYLFQTNTNELKLSKTVQKILIKFFSIDFTPNNHESLSLENQGSEDIPILNF